MQAVDFAVACSLLIHFPVRDNRQKCQGDVVEIERGPDKVPRNASLMRRYSARWKLYRTPARRSRSNPFFTCRRRGVGVPRSPFQPSRPPPSSTSASASCAIVSSVECNPAACEKQAGIRDNCSNNRSPFGLSNHHTYLSNFLLLYIYCINTLYKRQDTRSETREIVRNERRSMQL